VQVRQFLGAGLSLEPIPSLFSAAPDDRLAGLLVVGFVNGHSTTTWTYILLLLITLPIYLAMVAHAWKSSKTLLPAPDHGKLPHDL
jgi:hypothetical protein